MTAFDLNDPDFIANPYPVYAWLRDVAPVHYGTTNDLWLVSRHDDVLAVLRDARRFSSDLGNADDNPFNPALRSPRALSRLLDRLPPARTLLTSDPPDHTQLRRKVAKAFTPRRIAALEPRIRQIAEQLVDDLDGDLVRDLASPLPTIVIAEMMGIPAARRDDFKRWSDELVDGLLTGGSRLKMARSAIAISWFFARTVRSRRRSPGDDLISLLTTRDQDGDALTLGELVNFCILLLVAGNETTTNLISNAMLALFDRPDLWRRLGEDPGLASAAVEETLRYDGPAQGLLRITTTEVVIGDVTIPQGARVLPLLGAANRDPRHWADPDAFRLDRPSNDHIAFGSGIHYCIGTALARLEARVTLETLARRHPHLAPAGPPTRIQSPVLRGLRTLPVTVRPATVPAHPVATAQPG
ncbi:cytochrome P450 [Actinocorallia herbida]|uniref:Cytochrome P450 n=1 Tax=Actinocorallia herbida TaxID=58109 RepID=A0A3N1D088_9ACTN|nr:cytochrome P450 [Actinocorallia herbida]ROO86941.1 cytochrome P450 [Actinocorallia herbida]